MLTFQHTVRLEQEIVDIEDVYSQFREDTDRLIIRASKLSGLLRIENINKLRFMLVECEKTCHVQLSTLPALEGLHFRGPIAFSCTSVNALKDLMLGRCSSSITIPCCNDLSLLDCKVPSVTFEHPESLKRLSLRRVKDMDRIQMWPWQQLILNSLSIAQCKVLPLREIKSCSDLRTLILMDCGVLDNLEFLYDLPKLRILNLGGNTEVASGDLTPIESLSELETILFANRYHYNAMFKSYSGKLNDIVFKRPNAIANDS